MLKLLRSKGFLLVAVLAAVLVLSSAVFAIDTTKAIFLINGSLGDNSFYDSGEAGMKALAEEFGLDYRTIECGFDSAQYEPGLNAAVQFADIIFVISYGYEDILTQYADDFPDKIFVNLDTTVQNPGGTITSVDYVEEENAYLADVVAALVTSSDMPKANAEKIIGVVGGDTDPTVQSFIFAYKNGAEYIDPDVRTEVKFLGDWENSSKGKQAALQLYDQGADIVFQVAAAAGMGVLQASGERDLYSIGVDSNQNAIVPGHVVASDIKDVGLSIQNVYRTIVDGTYKPGEVLDYGLASGTVDVVFEDNGGVLPQEMIDKVAEVRDMIMNGDLTVERYSVE